MAAPVQCRDLERAIADYLDHRPMAEIIADQGVSRSRLYRSLQDAGVVRRNRVGPDAEGVGSLSIRISAALRNAARESAHQRGLSMPAYIAGLISADLGQRGLWPVEEA